ncbi:hypothetical protein L3N51_00672 [Metallosphaera sp. J1]|uniref:hypothetical protein n=1 Tax=Metallosphaera javensis (ex Hofmann et al. 2022) TaxID=99938 RepID=UPI001EDF90CE|nr:hypothetical protein [Metallosphaera javensis (ex Hofmann et al. 2022)]MCG3108391.1 hypothetical protein [Metallosphaera javensis (ex Hofmann et al. 2022)]
MTVWEFIADLSESILEHYEEKLRGLAFLPHDPVLMLVVLDGVDQISFLARGQIFQYFYKKERKHDRVRKMVAESGSDPSVIGIVISPNELGHHYPIVLSILSAGYILYDPSNIFKEKWKVVDYLGKKLIDVKNIKKGEVVEI